MSWSKVAVCRCRSGALCTSIVSRYQSGAFPSLSRCTVIVCRAPRSLVGTVTQFQSSRSMRLTRSVLTVLLALPSVPVSVKCDVGVGAGHPAIGGVDVQPVGEVGLGERVLRARRKEDQAQNSDSAAMSTRSCGSSVMMPSTPIRMYSRSSSCALTVHT